MKQQSKIHFDRIRVSGPCKHKPKGKKWSSTDEETGEYHVGGPNWEQTTLEEGAGTIRYRSRRLDNEGMATELWIECCPPHALQKHNWCGHADLAEYVLTLFECLTHKLGIKVSADDWAAWAAGDVRLYEAHLTANFACPAERILGVVNAIDENNGAGKHRDGEKMISLGWTPKGRSKTHMLSIYYKWDEMKRRFGTHPGAVRRRLLDESKHAIRAEVKLYSQPLKKRGLGTVRGWCGIDADWLYFDILGGYRIDVAVQQELTDDELAMLTASECRTYRLWLRGDELKELYSRGTIYKHAKAIKEKTSVDITARRRPEKLPDLDLSKIFHPSNMLSVPPWLIGTKYYHPPV